MLNRAIEFLKLRTGPTFDLLLGRTGQVPDGLPELKEQRPEDPTQPTLRVHHFPQAEVELPSREGCKLLGMPNPSLIGGRRWLIWQRK